jgi:hypothetical protein
MLLLLMRSAPPVSLLISFYRANGGWDDLAGLAGACQIAGRLLAGRRCATALPAALHGGHDVPCRLRRGVMVIEAAIWDRREQLWRQAGLANSDGQVSGIRRCVK